eukprot:scaffold2357_cov399-Prasinococcus_capsulatus_cf.AAC.4
MGCLRKGFPFAVFTRQLINAGLLAMLTTAERDAGIKPSNAGKSVAAGTHEGQSAWVWATWLLQEMQASFKHSTDPQALYLKLQATPTKTPKSSGVPKSAKSASTKSKPKTAAVDSSKKDSKKRKAGETPKEASSAKNKKVKGLTSSGQPPSRIACVGRKLTIIDDGNKYSAFLTTGVGKRWEIKYYEGVGTIDAQIEVRAVVGPCEPENEVIEDIDAEARNGALVIDEGPLEDVDKMYAWAAAEYNAFAQTSDPSPLPPRHATLPPPQSAALPQFYPRGYQHAAPYGHTAGVHIPTPSRNSIHTRAAARCAQRAAARLGSQPRGGDQPTALSHPGPPPAARVGAQVQVRALPCRAAPRTHARSHACTHLAAAAAAAAAAIVATAGLAREWGGELEDARQAEGGR